MWLRARTPAEALRRPLDRKLAFLGLHPLLGHSQPELQSTTSRRD